MRAVHTARSCAADLLAELDREVAVGVVVERFGERSDEQRLLGRTALLAEQPDRLDEAAAVEGRALDLRRHILRQRGGRRRDRAAEPLERELAVEQFRVGRGALEIAVGLSGTCRRRAPRGRPNNSPWSGPGASGRPARSGRTSRSRSPDGSSGRARRCRRARRASYNRRERRAAGRRRPLPAAGRRRSGSRYCRRSASCGPRTASPASRISMS